MFAARAYRLFAQQMAEREERLVAVLERLDTTVERNSRVIERNNRAFERNSAALADVRDEIRANTRAILRLLDRLDGGEQPA